MLALQIVTPGALAGVCRCVDGSSSGTSIPQKGPEYLEWHLPRCHAGGCVRAHQQPFGKVHLTTDMPEPASTNAHASAMLG